MKTNTKLLFVIGIAAALVVGFLIGITVDFPKTSNSDLSGTFGKAEKYRKPQMTQKDIKLRTELIKDTAQLKEMLRGLVYFSVFTEKFRADIEECLISFQSRGMNAGASQSAQVKALQEYADYIRNNNKSLNTTIAMLAGLSENGAADPSQDVEKNLRDFGNYVAGLNRKDTVLTSAMASMDNFLLGDKSLQGRKAELERLKSIRDQLLIKGIQMGGLLGNKEQVGIIMSYALSSQDKLNFIFSQEKLSLLAGEKLQIESRNLLSAVNQSGLGVVVGARSSADDRMGVVYDKANLQYIILDKSGLAFDYTSRNQLNIYGSSEKLQLLCIFGKENLNIILSEYSLQSILNSQLLNGYLATDQLGRILSVDNLSVVLLATGGLNSILNSISSELGIVN